MGIKSKFDYINNLVKNWNPLIFFISESEIRERNISILQIKGYDLILAPTLMVTLKNQDLHPMSSQQPSISWSRYV